MTDWTSRLFKVHRRELPFALLAACFYFSILCGYFLLRPVREAMGVSRGMDELRWLFLVTSAASLLFVMAFGGLAGRVERRKFIPLAYLFVIACLALFAGLLIADRLAGGGLIGSGAETLVARIVSYSYYIWLSVINLFVNSLFWAYMVDIFTVEQGKRLFAFIGVGGTLGSVVGGFGATTISALSNSPYLAAGLMLLGALMFAVAIAIMLKLDRMVLRSGGERSANRGAPGSASGERHEPHALGGTFWDGAAAVLKSPYLLGIGAYIALMAISNTMIYFTQAQIVLDSTDTFSERLRGFAQFDLLAETATLLTQLFLTARIIARLGVGWTLAILPLITVAGFSILAVWPIYGVMALFQAIHRAGRYAVSRPARETLFGVLTPADKYKAKPVVDVFVYRGGDVAGAGIDATLRALGLTISWIAAATVPLAALWTALSLALGRVQQRKASAQAAVEAQTPPGALRAEHG